MAFDLRALRQLLPHVLAWFGFIVYEQAVFLLSGTPPVSVGSMLLNYLLNIGLFYTNSRVLLPRYYEQRRYGLYACLVLVLLAAYALLRSGLYLYLGPAWGLGAAPMPATGPATRFSFYWAQSFYRGTFFQLISTGYWFARRAVQLEVQKRLHEAELRAAELSLLEANLAFLKSQINPHFLFNALNFLYAQIYPHSEPAAKGILLLSETMRYALHEDHNGKVMLAQEVKHLHNYIALNQLRFNNKLQLTFEVEGSTHFLLIMPLVLITFVENCFKHGELTDEAHPVAIRLTLVQNQLSFRTYNKKRTGPKEKSTSIGLVNTRRRLELMYPGRYTLAVEDAPAYYTCTLLLTL